MPAVNVRLLVTGLIMAMPISASTSTTAPPPMKTIELEWEHVENAFGYEVKLTPAAGGQPLSFRTTENKLTQQVPAGVYSLRLRARHKDAEDHWSPWSDSMRVEVLSKELDLVYPLQDAVIEAGGVARQEVRFAWTSVEKAKSYTLKIWTEETKDKPLTFVTAKNTQRLKLLPGRVYFWQVTFQSSTSVSYVQQLKTASFALQGAKLVQPSINALKAGQEPSTLTWKGSKKAKDYRAVLFYRHLDQVRWTEVHQAVVTKTAVDLQKLKPGAYKLEVTARAPRRAHSDPGKYEFLVKPKKQELLQALQN